MPGVAAPEFQLDRLVPETGALELVRLSESAGRVRLLNIVNSLDTAVCQVETRRWDRTAHELGPDVTLFTISMDLPFAQARWCGAEQARHRALSAHRDEAFGRAYGVLIKEWRLLQRAVIVVGRDGRVVYADYVEDQMAEPDYDAVIAAARGAAGAG
jgi:thioredoxin-dependent peroxiredoxin